MVEEIHLTIDGKKVVVPKGTTILEASKLAEVGNIQTLCYHPRLAPAGKCMVCVVKVEGEEMMKASCATACAEGMVVYTNTPDVRAESHKNMMKTVGSAPGQAATRFADTEMEALINNGCDALIDESAPALTRDMSMCVGCTRCVRACQDLQGMNMLKSSGDGGYPLVSTPGDIPIGNTECIECGQCAAFCPTGAIKEKNHINATLKAIEDGKVMVLQCAPATRVAIAEMFGKAPGSIGTGKLVAASKAAGFQYVFDTNFTADLTIMEEGTEFLGRVKNGGKFPMFTSCCPAWINMVEKCYPEFIPNLSSCRSPQMMMAPLVKKYWAEKMNIDPKNIFHVSMMPCVAKKAEIERDQLKRDGMKDCDAVLTTREMGEFLKIRGITNWDDVPEMEWDNPLGESTGAAALFANSGGVMEAALRTAYEVHTGETLPDVNLTAVRGLENTREATIKVGELDVKVAIASGGKAIRALMKKIKESPEPLYHFVEMMACPGGCIGGGGQPKSLDPLVRQARQASIYKIDETLPKRKSHENEDIKKLYAEYLGEPNGHLSHELLHCTYQDRTADVMMPKEEAADAAPMGDGKRIAVLFGSQGGTAAKAAKDFAEVVRTSVKGSAVSVGPANGFGADALAALAATGAGKEDEEKPAAVVIVSTFGDGLVPDNAAELYAGLEGKSLEGLQVAVFGLGSKAYGDAFCKAARDYADRLVACGAELVVPCDDKAMGDAMATGGYASAFDSWVPECVKAVGGGMKAVTSEPPKPEYSVSLAVGGHKLKQPCPNNYHLSTLITNQKMTNDDYDRAIHLLEFEISETGLDYVVGDHVGLLPRNDPALVGKFLEHFGLDGRQSVVVRKSVADDDESIIPSSLTINELFEQYMDLNSTVSRKQLKAIALFCTERKEREAIEALAADEEKLGECMQETTVCEALMMYKSALVPIESLISLIPVIKPRLYSIASSSRLHPTVIQLVVVGVKYNTPKGTKREGLCTSYCFRQSVGAKVPVQVHHGILYPPEDPETPTIMIGLGTGVAPFRGFLQEREAQLKEGIKLGPCVFYYACRHHDKDFVLKAELDAWKKSGALTELHTAFSHDQAEFITVPVIIGRNPEPHAKIFGSEGVISYYCGPAMGIPETIMQSFTDSLVSVGGKTKEEAAAYYAKIEKEGRWRPESF